MSDPENGSGLTAEDYMEAVYQEATAADPDVEDKLARLDELSALRRKDPAIEREYEELRNELQAYLEGHGPRFYLDHNGVKRYAYRVQPEPLEVDEAELVRLVEAGEINVDLDVVAPRKVNKEQLRRAVAKGTGRNANKPGAIRPEQLLKIARLVKGTPHVRFADPRDDL